MAEVTGELMYEVLKSVQARLEQVDGKADETNRNIMAMRSQMVGIQHELLSIREELGGIHATLVRHEHRLDRIERRLELSDAPSL